MKTLVIYASRKGNTKLVAERIAETLRSRGAVELIDAEDAPLKLPQAELIFVGGPTEAHSLTKPMVHFFEGLAGGALAGRAAAAFDTRLSWPRLLSGSAAVAITKYLRDAGAVVVVPPESFIVSAAPELLPGEIERAGYWATTVAEKAETKVVVPVH